MERRGRSPVSPLLLTGGRRRPTRPAKRGQSNLSLGGGLEGFLVFADLNAVSGPVMSATERRLPSSPKEAQASRQPGGVTPSCLPSRSPQANWPRIADRLPRDGSVTIGPLSRQSRRSRPRRRPGQARQQKIGEHVDDGVVGQRRSVLTRRQNERVPSEIIAATVRRHRPSVNHMLGPVPIWQDRHTVLVGDAIHPVGAGQGASMVIEDGVALASALAASDSIPDGLAEFERRRRPRVGEMLKTSDDNRAAKQAGRLRLRAQEIVMPVMVRLFYERMTAWLYTYQPDPLPARADQPAA